MSATTIRDDAIQGIGCGGGWNARGGTYASRSARPARLAVSTRLEITEQHPDHRVAWKALDQDGPNGFVSFDKLDDARTKVQVRMSYDREGMKESIGSLIGLDSSRVKGDLESFKEFIESRGGETGAWRGEVKN